MTPDPSRRVTVDVERDAESKPKVFLLRLGHETVALEPGRNWIQTDHYKWTTRGLIEAPQSFHVRPNRTVDINGESIAVDDPQGATRLEAEINKRHTLAAKPAAHAAAAAKAAAPLPDRVVFRVRLDHLGHLALECQRGTERTATGLRGLPMLIENGFMLRPQNLHVDPLQRYLELDGVRFECSEPGAAQLQETLNARYAPRLEEGQACAVEIRDNPAAATGFDIHFWTVVAGARFEIKGHLNQEHLDVLQDHAKCDLLQPGILLRLSPPFLLVRRRRPDGGEEPVPGLPDLQYRRATAQQVQALLNHPLVRRGGAASALPAAESGPPELVRLRVIRQPQDKVHLWIEGEVQGGGEPLRKALTHHNIADLQQAGLFQPHWDVTLSLDNRTLGFLDTRTGTEERIEVPVDSSDETLQAAGDRLTAVLRPPTPRPAPATARTHGPDPVMSGPAPTPDPTRNPALATPSAAAVRETPAPAAGKLEEPKIRPSSISGTGPSKGPRPATGLASPAAGPVKPELAPAAPVSEPEASWFAAAEPLHVAQEVFRSVADRLRLPIQDVLLSLPRVFENRRFEILSFDSGEIDSVMQLRSSTFYGMYLSFITPERIDLVYACSGCHIEWGPDKCVVQTSPHAEPAEHKTAALLGLAQNADRHFVFIVRPAFRQWVKPHEKLCEEAYAHFLSPAEYRGAQGQLTLLWPPPPAGP
ncbi:MAG TPA: hypothetical protein PKM73_02170 [Verrucomicrobiota bacterium]|nr:hypothetical protein [Verrucomicrobiota bacterium]HNU50359.1 hypothetical protein [Verrucomicrobiota bacterium]